MTKEELLAGVKNFGAWIKDKAAMAWDGLVIVGKTVWDYMKKGWNWLKGLFTPSAQGQAAEVQSDGTTQGAQRAETQQRTARQERTENSSKGEGAFKGAANQKGNTPVFNQEKQDSR